MDLVNAQKLNPAMSPSELASCCLDNNYQCCLLLLSRTTKRAQTLHDGQPTSPPGVCHIPMAEPFCNRTREVSLKYHISLVVQLLP